MLLRQACPSGLRVIGAPFAVRPDKFNELRPDLIVARYVDLTERDLPGAPLLAVEVISPTSRLRDASLKRAVYARLGVPSFWLIDPDPERPALTAFQLAGSGYRQEAHVVGSASWTTSRPFLVSVVPADLVAGLRP
jgi:Uma2 family endonuclease